MKGYRSAAKRNQTAARHRDPTSRKRPPTESLIFAAPVPPLRVTDQPPASEPITNGRGYRRQSPPPGRQPIDRQTIRGDVHPSVVPTAPLMAIQSLAKARAGYTRKRSAVTASVNADQFNTRASGTGAQASTSRQQGSTAAAVTLPTGDRAVTATALTTTNVQAAALGQSPLPASTRTRLNQHRRRSPDERHSILYMITWPFVATVRRFPIATMIILGVSTTLFLGTWATYHFVFEDLPPVEELTTRPLAASSSITDRNGTLLYTLYDDENRTPVPLHTMSTYLIQATIAIEDQSFFTHQGFSPKGIARAIKANFQGESVQGGSTITQQLVKNRLLSREKTYTRKLRELILAIMVERKYPKEQILEMYLNTVAYGGSTYGIEAAARRYFNKSAQKLTLAESALLAGLPQAPSIYSPFGSNPELATMRQQEVLRRMVEENYITAEQAEAAQQEKLVYNTDSTQILAPHFVMYVRDQLEEKYGETLLTTGGLKIKTTLDLPLQNQTQKIVTDEITALKRLRIKNGAAMVTNPKTGEILAMVGSTNYFDFANDGQVNVALRPRQPGSSIKPLTYSLALERGLNVLSTIEDSPVSYVIPGAAPYAPKNYDGKYHGHVTLKEALASSYNIPAVKLLAMVGINNEIDRAEAMGITTWKDRSRFGLSLTLGGGEVRMIDMTTLYGVFANQGYRVDVNPILEVSDAQGNVLYRNECAIDQSRCYRRLVTDPKVAYQITNILSDNKARTPAFGPISTLYIPGQQVAVKTGTTNSLRDNWTIGYTDDRVVAVWVGNNDNTPMSYVASGVTGASPIWNKIIRTQLDDAHPHQFTPPPGMVEQAGCGTSTINAFVAGTEPKAGCPTPTPKPEEKKTE